jgi:antitoxin component YwqK of YwqJK toxin-antitoxin module
MKKLLLAILLTVPFILSAQEGIKPNGYNIFYHENGVISSEGTMRDGKPDGYWKTYNEQGILISEGNRNDFMLDSTWKFYDDEGKLKLEINYLKGKKEGIRKTYRKDEVIAENFKNDIKDGFTRYYYPDGTLKKEVNFVSGLEEGTAREFGEDGRIITLISYKSGFIVNIEKINRYDNAGKKHGIWRHYYDDGVLRLEGSYKRGLEHGYFKEYDRSGNLLTTTKYENGVKIEDAKELVKLDVRKDYYPSGQVKISASYNKEGKLEGVRREFNEDGTIDKSYIFRNGIMIGEGIVTEKGERDGYWKEYYNNGALRAEGNYQNDIKTGKWKFYHVNGKLKQEGNYNTQGQPEGEWYWYYESGELLREEYYYLGQLDGLMVEYSEEGEIIAQGQFIEGLEDGDWIYRVGDALIEGSYLDGMRDGNWKYWNVFDEPGIPNLLRFEGRFIEDNPHGVHTWYWDNGNKKDEGEYQLGLKKGDWISYDYLGMPFLVITYRDGIEVKYDGMKIQASID